MDSEISLLKSIEEIEIKNVFIRSKLNGMVLDARGNQCYEGNEVKIESFGPKVIIKKLR